MLSFIMMSVVNTAQFLLSIERSVDRRYTQRRSGVLEFIWA